MCFDGVGCMAEERKSWEERFYLIDILNLYSGATVLQGAVIVIHTVLMLTTAVSAVAVPDFMGVAAEVTGGAGGAVIGVKAPMVGVLVEALVGVLVGAPGREAPISLPDAAVERAEKLVLNIWTRVVRGSVQVVMPLVMVRRVVRILDTCWRHPIFPSWGESTISALLLPPVTFTRVQD